jgi:hypothetical protein
MIASFNGQYAGRQVPPNEVEDAFSAESGHDPIVKPGHDLLVSIAVGEVVDGCLDDWGGDLDRFVLVKHEVVETRNLGLGRGGEQLGVEVLCFVGRAADAGQIDSLVSL